MGSYSPLELWDHTEEIGPSSVGAMLFNIFDEAIKKSMEPITDKTGMIDRITPICIRSELYSDPTLH